MTLLSRKYIDEHDIVPRYLANQLSEAERESFEAYYIEHPEILKELHRTAQFKSGLMDLNDSGVLEKLAKQRPWLKRARGIAIAASIILAVIGGSIWLSHRDAQPILAASVSGLSGSLQSTLPLAESYDIQRTRTSSYDATIKLPIRPSAIELRIKPEVIASPALYRINLIANSENNTSTIVAALSDVAPTKNGFVAIYLNASALSAGVYEVRISGEIGTNAANSESSFLIELMHAPHD